MTDPDERGPDDSMPWRVRIVVAFLIMAQLAVSGLIRLRRFCYRARWRIL